jgi:chorismate dehydratase
MNSLPSATEHEPASAAPVKPLRLGVVRYLNMLPLIYGLDRYPEDELQLIEGTPGELADWLEQGRIDMGMVPVVSLFSNPDWRVVGHNMIGSAGPVRSVLLVGDHPESATRLHPDSHSRTSNILARIMLRNHFGNDRIEVGEVPWNAPVRAGAVPDEGDLQVLIGSHANAWISRFSPATRTVHPKEQVASLDLGECWTRWTGLPFVYAVWAARPDTPTGAWPERLKEQCRLNLSRIGEVVSASPHLDEELITTEDAKSYLMENIQFTLDDRAVQGLNHFYQLGVELGLFPAGWHLDP